MLLWLGLCASTLTVWDGFLVGNPVSLEVWGEKNRKKKKNSQPSLAALGLVCQTMAETALAPDSNGIIYSKWSPKPSLLRQMEVSKGCL